MYLIALCDDEEAELDRTERMLRRYGERHSGEEFVIGRFESADELLGQIREKKYMPDCILMDIYMPGQLGIEAAQELRSMGNNGRIVFLTTSREYALDAFGVDAAQYLVKPVSEKMLFSVMDKILGDIDGARSKYLLLRIEGKIQRVVVDEIVYCEAEGKSQYLYMADGERYELRRTMTEVYEMLSGYPEFSRVGAAYIVNMEHVNSLNNREVQMDNGKKIYLPRGSYRPLRERYFRYYCEENEVF